MARFGRSEEAEWDDPIQPPPPPAVEPDEDAPEVLPASSWPPPEIPGRPPQEGDPIPKPATAALALALRNGWDARLGYARGTVPVALNRWIPGKVVDAVYLECRKPGVRVEMDWQDGKARRAWLSLPGQGRTRITHPGAKVLLGALVKP